MAHKFIHDEIYRGPDQLAALANVQLVLCGAGALGSLLADNLARQGFARLRVIDRDRVEEHNVNTQLYGLEDVGARKVDVLRNRLFRSVGVEIEAQGKDLTERTCKSLLKGADLVLDLFDNHASRQVLQTYCRQTGLVCLHVGLFADYCEVVWDAQYRVPADAEGDVCEYPLARNLVLLAVSLAAETVVSYVLDGQQVNRTATLRDFAVRELES